MCCAMACEIHIIIVPKSAIIRIPVSVKEAKSLVGLRSHSYYLIFHCLLLRLLIRLRPQVVRPYRRHAASLPIHKLYAQSTLFQLTNQTNTSKFVTVTGNETATWDTPRRRNDGGIKKVTSDWLAVYVVNNGVTQTDDFIR